MAILALHWLDIRSMPNRAVSHSTAGYFIFILELWVFGSSGSRPAGLSIRRPVNSSLTPPAALSCHMINLCEGVNARKYLGLDKSAEWVCLCVRMTGWMRLVVESALSAHLTRKVQYISTSPFSLLGFTQWLIFEVLFRCSEKSFFVFLNRSSIYHHIFNFLFKIL